MEDFTFDLVCPDGRIWATMTVRARGVAAAARVLKSTGLLLHLK